MAYWLDQAGKQLVALHACKQPYLKKLIIIFCIILIKRIFLNPTGGVTIGCGRRQQHRMQTTIKLIKVINPPTPKHIHNPLSIYFKFIINKMMKMNKNYIFLLIT